MKPLRLLLALALAATAVAQVDVTPTPADAVAPAPTSDATPAPMPTATPVPAAEEGLRAAIERYLGRPYVWGGSGLKSFDCSGFVWRVMLDSGILVKRTTARKLYLILPKVDEERQLEFSNLVFFNDLEHCGIVNDRSSFFHAQCTKGTNLSSFDPYWRSKLYGFRAMPGTTEKSGS